jgi:hypothetical protein
MWVKRVVKIVIHPKIIAKLAARGISGNDVGECFGNAKAGDIIDLREGNKTTPDTRWFISQTNNGRELKIVYMLFEKRDEAIIKSTYAPNRDEKHLYIFRAPSL